MHVCMCTSVCVNAHGVHTCVTHAHNTFMSELIIRVRAHNYVNILCVFHGVT